MTARSSWPLWAHDRDGEFQNIGEKWWVEIHGPPQPVVPVLVTEAGEDPPASAYWGWIDAAKESEPPRMIWAFQA